MHRLVPVRLACGTAGDQEQEELQRHTCRRAFAMAHHLLLRRRAPSQAGGGRSSAEGRAGRDCKARRRRSRSLPRGRARQDGVAYIAWFGEEVEGSLSRPGRWPMLACTRPPHTGRAMHTCSTRLIALFEASTQTHNGSVDRCHERQPVGPRSRVNGGEIPVRGSNCMASRGGRLRVDGASSSQA